MQPVQNPVHRREQREHRDEPAERGAERLRPSQVRERRGREHCQADHVREARRARVLQRSLAEPRLQHLEVEEAGQAPAAAEREAERELEREQREQPPRPDGDPDQCDQPDDRLVRPRPRASITSRVAVGIGCALHAQGVCLD